MNPPPGPFVVLIVCLAASGLQAAGTLAHWPCAVTPGPARRLADVGPHQLESQADARAVSVPGRFDRALRPLGPARSSRVWPRPDCWNGPWTLECWLRLDAGVDAEAVIFELAEGPVAVRFGILPGENAFLWTAPAADPGPGVAARRVELPSPDGPPGEVVWLREAALDLRDASLPRERWFHVALVHAPGGGLRLFLDGRVAAVAAWHAAALPGGLALRIALGASPDGARVLAGALQDVRVSDRIVYGGEFAPPEGPLQP